MDVPSVHRAQAPDIWLPKFLQQLRQEPGYKGEVKSKRSSL